MTSGWAGTNLRISADLGIGPDPGEWHEAKRAQVRQSGSPAEVRARQRLITSRSFPAD